MRCHQYKNGLILYLYGEITDDDRHRLERHIETCALCRQEIEAFRPVIERSAPQTPLTPSERVLKEIRTAAARAVTKDTGTRAARCLWDYRWDGVRPRLIAAAACAFLVVGVTLLAHVIVREPGQSAQEPPAIATEHPAGLWVTEGEPIRYLPASLLAEMSTPTGLEEVLAGLEADTFYIEEQMAFDTAPLLDRQVRSLEHAVVRLAFELE